MNIQNSALYPVNLKEIDVIKSIIEKYWIILPDWVKTVEVRWYGLRKESPQLPTLKDNYGLFYIIIDKSWFTASFADREIYIVSELTKAHTLPEISVFTSLLRLVKVDDKTKERWDYIMGREIERSTKDLANTFLTMFSQCPEFKE